MKILICLATDLEKQPVEEKLSALAEKKEGSYAIGKHLVEFQITGVGAVSTVFALTTKKDVKTYDLLLQAGIAGAFNETLPVGLAVEVVSERFADLGIEERDGSFLDVFQAGLSNSDEFPFHQGVLYNPERYTDLQAVQGITVNKVHGEINAIEKVSNLYHPDVESMEGAAFFYTALRMGIPFCQMRTISNRVEPRDRSKWNIPLALNALADEVIRFVKQLK